MVTQGIKIKRYHFNINQSCPTKVYFLKEFDEIQIVVLENLPKPIHFTNERGDYTSMHTPKINLICYIAE